MYITAYPSTQRDDIGAMGRPRANMHIVSEEGFVRIYARLYFSCQYRSVMAYLSYIASTYIESGLN